MQALSPYCRAVNKLVRKRPLPNSAPDRAHFRFPIGPGFFVHACVSPARDLPWPEAGIGRVISAQSPSGWCFTFTPRTAGLCFIPCRLSSAVFPRRERRDVKPIERGALFSRFLAPPGQAGSSGCPSNPKAATRGTQKTKNFLSCSRSSEGRNRWLKSKRNPDTASASPAAEKVLPPFVGPRRACPPRPRVITSRPRLLPGSFLVVSACQRENRRLNGASSGHGDSETTFAFAVHLIMQKQTNKQE